MGGTVRLKQLSSRPVFWKASLLRADDLVYVFLITYDFAVVVLSAAVGGGEGGGALFQIPGLAAALCRAADGYCVDAVGVAVTWTVIATSTAIPWRPNKDWAPSFPALWRKRKNISLHFVSHLILLITETSIQQQPGVYAQENKGDQMQIEVKIKWQCKYEINLNKISQK